MFTTKGRRKLTFLLRYLELTANNPSRKHAVRLDAMHEYLKSRKVRGRLTLLLLLLLCMRRALPWPPSSQACTRCLGVACCRGISTGCVW